MTDDTTPEPASTQERPAPRNWRPTRAETGVAVVVSVALVALLTALGGGAPAAASALGGVGLASCLLWFGASRRRAAARVLASVLLVPTGGLLLYGLLGANLGPGPVRLGPAVVALGVGVAAGGAVAVPWDPVDARSLSGAATAGVAALVLPVGSLGGLVAVEAVTRTERVGPLLSRVQGILLATGTNWRGADALPVVVLLVAVACLGSWMALRALPVAELAAPDRRESVAARVAAATQTLVLLGVVSALLAVVLLGALSAAPAGELPLGGVPQPLAAALVGAANATALRAALLLVAVASAAIVAVVAVAKRVPAVDREWTAQWGAPVAGGGVVTVTTVATAPTVVAVALDARPALRPSIGLLAENVGAATVLLGGVGALYVIPVSVFLTLAVLGRVLFPDQAATAAVASAGLFVATVGAARVGVAPVVVFVGIAGCLTVWDVSRHAEGLGAEVGRAGRSRHVELVHAGGSALVGGVGVGLAVGGLVAAGVVPVSGSVAAPVALVGALGGVAVLLVVARAAVR